MNINDINKDTAQQLLEMSTLSAEEMNLLYYLSESIDSLINRMPRETCMHDLEVLRTTKELINQQAKEIAMMRHNIYKARRRIQEIRDSFND